MDQFYRFDNLAMTRLHGKKKRVLQIDRRYSVAPMIPIQNINRQREEQLKVLMSAYGT